MPLVNPERILVVEDDNIALQNYIKTLSRQGYSIFSASTLASAKELTSTKEFDAAILDLQLPDGTTLDWIHDLRTAHPHTALIMITGAGDIPTAVTAIKRGADNFLCKPVAFEELIVILKKSLESAHLRRRSDAHKMIHDREQDSIFGTSQQINATMELADIAAKDNTIVVLYGETGTGKGVLARWIHDNSDRVDEPFVELNCSILKGDLLKSELFGHSKGAFTGAACERIGLIESANHGTLFLDEIGEMSLEVQAQVLKVIEERTYRRIGEDRVRTSDFRLICATNRDLQSEVEKETFRRDLFYRINVFPINTPPLRERPEDIKILADNILKKIGYSMPLSPEVISILTSSKLDGNIRELRNLLERAKLLSRGGNIVPAHLGNVVKAEIDSTLPTRWNLEEIENELILKAVNHFSEKTQAARELGISISSLYRRLETIQGNTPVNTEQSSPDCK